MTREQLRLLARFIVDELEARGALRGSLPCRREADHAPTKKHSPSPWPYPKRDKWRLVVRDERGAESFVSYATKEEAERVKCSR